MSSNLSVKDLNASQERHAQTLKSIQELQEVERQLYINLEAQAAAGADLSEQKAIVDRINEISTARITLYNTLKGMYSVMQTSVAGTRNELVDQMTITGVVEQELNNTKSSINALTDEKNNKLRMVEINTYYGKRYQAHTGLMKLIILICIPLLILAILGKKGLVPSNIASGLATVIIAIGAILVVRRLWDLDRRDNMNYDEYDWYFDQNASSPTVWEYDRDHLFNKDTVKNWGESLGQSVGLCVDDQCCPDGYNYESDANKCVLTQGTTESFGNNRTGDTVTLGSNTARAIIKPFDETGPEGSDFAAAAAPH